MIPPLLTPGRARWLLYLPSRSAIRVRCRCHPRVQPRRRVADRVPVAWAEGWPDAEAVETVDLHGTDGVTRVKMNLAFRDQAGRDHMTKTDGQEDSLGQDGGLPEVADGSRRNCPWYLRFGARPQRLAGERAAAFQMAGELRSGPSPPLRAGKAGAHRLGASWPVPLSGIHVEKQVHRARLMKLLLTSAGIKNASIHDALGGQGRARWDAAGPAATAPPSAQAVGVASSRVMERR